MRLIDADAVYKILESCEIRKATIGNPLTDWEYGYTCGIERAETEIECAPYTGCSACQTWTLLEEFEDLCKYIREVTGSDLVCGLCEYDAGTVGEEPIECPGFDSNECFKLKESFKQRFPGYNGHEVIRCKDCKWHIKGGFCDLYFADTAADEYCSRAERREE